VENSDKKRQNKILPSDFDGVKELFFYWNDFGF